MMTAVADVQQHLLQPKGNQDYAKDQREVCIGVGIARQPRPGLLRLSDQRMLAQQRTHVEIRPPQGRGQQQAQHRGGDDHPGNGFFGHSETNGHDRLAEGNDDDQAMPLGEMPRGGQPPSSETT